MARKHERLIEDLQVSLSERDAEIIRLNMFLNDNKRQSEGGSGVGRENQHPNH